MPSRRRQRKMQFPKRRWTPACRAIATARHGSIATPLNAIPYQPRQTFDEAEIADLADSIRTHGFLQPLIVRRTGDSFELVAGERRLRAALAADWKQVPVQIRDVDDRQMAELAIVENVQRKDLNAIEKAESFQRYIDQYQCTQEELASRVQIDRSTVANLIRLLELPEDVKRMVQEGDISQGHARALLPLGDEQEQIDFARRIKKEGLSVRATEQAVQERIQRARRRAAADRRRRWQFAAGRQSAQRANRISRTGAQQRSGHEGRSVANGQRPRANHDPFQKPRRILAIAANSDCETSTGGTRWIVPFSSHVADWSTGGYDAHWLPSARRIHRGVAQPG